MNRGPSGVSGRLAAVYFADMVGYTSISSQDEPAALRLVARLQDLSAREIAGRGGRVVKFVGDAVLAEFSRRAHRAAVPHAASRP